MVHSLCTPIFSFSCEPKIFENDIPYPTNTILHVAIDSDGFCANADLDIDIKSFAKFAVDLQQMCITLKGTTSIREPFGHQNFIRFTVDHHGHIQINGVVDNCGKNGHFQKLTFESDFDQTFLSAFANSLANAYKKYLPL